MGNDTVQIKPSGTDKTASFKTAFEGISGFFKGLVKTSPAMTVEEVWQSRKDDINKRANLAGYAGPMGFDRVIGPNSVNYGSVSRTEMATQWDQVAARFNQFIVS